MENEQHDEKSGDALQRRLSLLSDSAVGVVIIRTKESYRAVGLLREWAAARFVGIPFRMWDCVAGWLSLADNNAGTSIDSPPQLDPVNALKRIESSGGRWDTGAFVMLDLQKVVGDKNTQTLRLLLEYAQRFVSTRQRLYLVVPDSFSMPQELQASIPLVELHLPTRAELAESLHNVLSDACPENEERADYFTAREVELVTTSASGLSTQEAETAFSMAIKTHEAKWVARTMTSAEMSQVVLDVKMDIVRSSEVLEYMSPVDLTTVGGMEILKAYLARCVRCFTPEARRFGVEPLKGFALIGPPGTGKSLAAKATASVLGLPLVRMDIGKLFGSLVGESEGKLRAAFRQIVAMSPCVVLLDEVDKGLGGAHKAGGDSGVTMRMLGGILTFMQENRKPIVWIMTANRVEGLDSALTRKGRLDEIWSVLLPTAVERREIFTVHLTARGQTFSTRDLTRLVNATRGFVGSEIESAIKEAMRSSYTDGHDRLTVESVLTALNETKPMSVTHAEDFFAMQEWASHNARPVSAPDDVEQVANEILPPGKASRRRRLGGE